MKDECVCTATLRAARECSRLQLREYTDQGTWQRLDCLDAAFRLVAVAHYCICRRTRTLPVIELPGLPLLLSHLPPASRRRVERAVRAELAGRVHQETVLPGQSGGKLARRLLPPTVEEG